MNTLSALEQSETMVTKSADEYEELRGFHINYYRGLAYLALDSTAKAVSSLKNAIDIRTDSFLESKTRWYLALANLKSGNVKTTVKLLTKLSRNKQAGAYKQKAIQLLKALNKE